MNKYGMEFKELTFSDEEIAALFGHEAAEDEYPERLREYYFKNDIHDQIAANLPLRIVVGHKGIGKSAVFKIIEQELHDKNILTVSLTPDDIIEIAEDDTDMLKLIRTWRNGLTSIIANKALAQLCDKFVPVNKTGEKIVNLVTNLLESKMNVSVKKDMNEVVSSFLSNNKIVVFIDDLDRGWEGKKSDIRRISAMLNAVRDLARENNGVEFKVSLRTDVYYLYRTNDESTDKVEGSVVWVTWDNFSILALLAKRIVTYFGGSVSEDELLNSTQAELAEILNFVFQDRFEGKGKWDRIPIYRLLTSLIRKRPRDLVKLCSLAGKEARRNHSSKIGTNEFNSIFETYSQGRLQDTIIEFRSELPDIERLLTNMKPTREERLNSEGSLFKTDMLLKKVRNICERGMFNFSNGNIATDKELCAFMYKINFLTARKDTPEKIIRKYFEENKFLMNSFVDFGFDWEIHPAYRWALQPDNLTKIFDSLVIYED